MATPIAQIADTPDSTQPALKVYWQPGCSSCLRVKEFLTQRKVPFVSVNVLADKAGFIELAELGLRRVPIVRCGGEWADGQVLRDVARVAGIRFDAPALLPPAQLAVHADTILRCAIELAQRIPKDQLDTLFPDRPRSYRQVTAHIFTIVEAFLDMIEQGKRAEHAIYEQDVPAGITTAAQLIEYGEQVRARCATWWKRDGNTVDYAVQADVYYGTPTVHEFLERTVWHAGQHTRQLQLGVGRLGLSVDTTLTADALAGLPMPEGILDA
jgi:Glutaredoxin/DinB superfamily